MHTVRGLKHLKTLLVLASVISAHATPKIPSRSQDDSAWHKRRLLQTPRPTDAEPVSVETESELQTAISKATGDILVELTQHIMVSTSFVIPPTAMHISIWGKCDPDKSVLSEEEDSSACHITFSPSSLTCQPPCPLFTRGAAGVSQGWMSNLVLVYSSEMTQLSIGIDWSGGGELWLSDMRIKDFPDRGLSTSGIMLYMTDVLFDNNSVDGGGGGAIIEWNSVDSNGLTSPPWAVLTNCTFIGNNAAYANDLVIQDRTTEPRARVVLLDTADMDACVYSNPARNSSVIVSSGTPLQVCPIPDGGSTEIKTADPTGIISGQSAGDRMPASSIEWLEELCSVNVPGARSLYQQLFGVPYDGIATEFPSSSYAIVGTRPAFEAAVDDPKIRYIKITSDLVLNARYHDFLVETDASPNPVHFNFNFPERDSAGRMRGTAIWGECNNMDGRSTELLESIDAPTDTACYITSNIPTYLNITLADRSSVFTSYDSTDDEFGGRAPWLGWFSNLAMLNASPQLTTRAVTWSGGSLFMDRLTLSGFRDRAVRTVHGATYITNSKFVNNTVKVLETTKEGKKTNYAHAGGAIEIKLPDDAIDPGYALVANSEFVDNKGGVGGGATAIHYGIPPSDIVLYNNTYSGNEALELVGDTVCNFDNRIRLSKNATLDDKRMFLKGDEPYSFCSNSDLEPLHSGSIAAYLGFDFMAGDDWLEALWKADVPGAKKLLEQIRGTELESLLPRDTPAEAKDDSNWKVIVGVVCAVLASCLCCGLIAVSYARKKREQRAEAERVAKAKAEMTLLSKFGGNTHGSTPSGSELTRYIRFGTIGSAGSTGPRTGMYHQDSTMAFITNAYGAEKRPGYVQSTTAAPGQEKSATNFESEMQRLDAQLDSISKHGPFMQLYYLHGSESRRKGGQGLVQFAQDINGRDVAIKFFVSSESFAHERNLYMIPEIAAVCPDIHGGYDSAVDKLVDHNGKPLMSFIVFERGEALDEWARRNAPDTITGIQVVSHVAQCLMKLHNAGIAHRDLKPGNTLWLPRKNRWTLIDIGCSAPIGQMAPPMFSVRYAPPETIAAYERQDTLMRSTAAVDAWSLGVMAWELLTGERVFLQDSTDEVCDALMGRTFLPWEEDSVEEMKVRMGHMADTIMSLLDRDPTKRPSMQQVVARITALLGGVPQDDSLLAPSSLYPQQHEHVIDVPAMTGTTSTLGARSKESSRETSITHTQALGS